jgi:hypothetical protein
MNRFKRIANPFVVFVLICTFVGIYFVYLKGDNPLSFLGAPAEKKDKDWDEVKPKDPNVVALAGPAIQGQDLTRQPIQQNQVDQPNQPDVPQGNQNYVPQVQHNIVGGPQTFNQQVQPNQSAPLQPIAVPDRTLIEGHWIGLEVIPLTAAIAEANFIPPDVVGVLIDEVTMLSAEAGLYAGDVITAVNGKKVNDLKSFRLATKDVAQSNRATVSVYSGGKYKNIVVFSTEALGIAQMEGAPMILATSKSPHGYLGPCDRCHAISKNPMNSKNTLRSKNALNPNELLKDQGDSLTKVAPNIRKGTPPPHRNRGTCTTCHVVL